MFDNYTYSLFEYLPDLEGLNKDECRRTLSKAYMFSIKLRLNLIQESYLSVDLNSLTEDEFEIIEETQEDISDEFSNLYNELRRLGDTLESRAIFDNVTNDSLKASSFVAAEALSLLSTLLTIDKDNIESNNLLFSNELIYTRLEAAMLYLIAGYDANAFTEINAISTILIDYKINEQENDLLSVEYWGLKNIISFCSNELWNVNRNKPVIQNISKRKTLRNLIKENKFYMYSILGDSIINYMDWLIGQDDEGLKKSINSLHRINKISKKNKNALFPEIFHLSRVLMVMITETSKRSLYHKTPSPEDEKIEFIKYLKERAKGNRYIKSRPFIWESAKEFIKECLPGPNKHTIVNLPTGSGKSFIAELAVAQSLSKGWVLYLAPTNALVQQIKRDLKNYLQTYNGLEIRAYVGGDEYTTIQNELLDENTNNRFVAVMTPEKCAVSLRTNPEIFKECSLCVFDECHLLGENVRGVTADLVLGHVLSINNQIKLVLMSAMLGNPDDLLGWLNNVTNNETKISSISWKPTRSIRGAVGVETKTFKENGEKALESLSEKPENRKNEKFKTKTSFLYSLSGIWTTNSSNYSLMELNSKGSFKIHREKLNEGWDYSVEPDSWVNTTSSNIGLELSSKGIPTIVFISSNRHYPFSLARKLRLSKNPLELDELEESFLFLAEQELGTTSEVKKLLIDNGIGVHTSFMLDSEKEVVERLFKNRKIQLLFATGTLAQGVNLPSVAVVIAGTRIGDYRNAQTIEAQNRSKALILNAIGRAGRAGFSNQSLCLVVPDKPLLYKNNESDIEKAIRKLSVLTEKDASVKVISPLEEFLENIIDGAIQGDRASLDELTIMSMITTETNGEEGKFKEDNILNKTYAGYAIKQKSSEDNLDKAYTSITNVKKEFLKNANAPEYVLDIARKSGFDFFTTNTFIKVVKLRLQEKIQDSMIKWSIKEWKDFLIYSLKDMPPYFINKFLPENITQKPTFLNEMHLSLRGNFDSDLNWSKSSEWDNHWEEFSGILDLYMEGSPLSHIAKRFLKIEGEVDFLRSAGKPIPDTLAFIKDQIETLSSYAGLLVATLEELLFNDEDMPFYLNVLPLAIKNGLIDHSTHYWYNFTIRNRMVAHALAANLPLGELTDEEMLRKKVSQLKRTWLNNEIDFVNINENERSLLNAARIIIRNS